MKLIKTNVSFTIVEDVEVFWMDEGEGMFLVINKGDYEPIS